MSLPGGLLGQGGVVDRTYAWKPMDGAVESAFASAARMPSRAESVSCALEAALDRVGGETASRARVDALSVPDRRFLMIELARLLGLSAGWSSHACEACQARFDFPLDLADLPVQPGRTALPAVTVAGRTFALRAPTGADQIRVSAIDDDDLAARALAALCVVSGGKQNPTGFAGDLSDSDIEAIEAALEEALPQIPWAIEARCPVCKAANVIAIDVSAWLERMAAGPLLDVHEIASAYGWSERDILALPRARRREYLELIRGGGNVEFA